MGSGDDSRIVFLEEEVKKLSDELLQCQADKEFVWSLWKRLQVANPDLTQAVSLVVEREKEKAEIKNRKVLEILQSKDNTIQELNQKVMGQQQEINSLVQRKTAVEGESTSMKSELTALREQLAKKTQEFQEMKTEWRKKEEEQRQVVQALEEEKEGLTSRCVTLQADLEEEHKQANSQRDHGDAAQARLKNLEEELQKVWQERSALKDHNTELEARLTSKEKEMAAKEDQLNQLCRDFAEMETLYRDSTKQAEAQSHLIKQLEGLNIDAQRVMRNQEEAHTANTTSYQQLYKELSQCYQALMSGEAKLRQSHQQLSSQLSQKNLYIIELEAQLQQQHEELSLIQCEQTATYHSPNKQTNFKPAVSEQADFLVQRPPSVSDQTSTQYSDPRPEDQSLHHRSSGMVRRKQRAPVQRSRSLSPASSVGLGSRKKKEVDQRTQDIVELLQLKMEENEELKKAHNKRCERLRLIRSNYKSLKEQLKEMKKSSGLSSGKIKRATQKQLQQENSDAVWNELTYLKNLNRKLSIEKVGLEEELDVLRVQAATDRTRVKELHLSLPKDQQEWHHKMAQEHQVKSSTPKNPVNSSSQVEQSFKKIEQLERRMVSLEGQTVKLREEKVQLLEANEGLAHNCRKLQTTVDHLRTQEVIRKEEAHTQAMAQEAKHHNKIVLLETRLSEFKKETTKLHHQLMRMRQDRGILKAGRDFYRNRCLGQSGAGSIVNNISSKVRFKTTRCSRQRRHRSHQTISPNQAITWQSRSPTPSRDEWEDISIDSGSGTEYSDSLNSVSAQKARHKQQMKAKASRYTLMSKRKVPTDKSNRKKTHVPARDDKQHLPWEQRTGGGRKRWKTRKILMKKQNSSTFPLQQRIESLQRHVDILQSAKKDAVLSANELRRANKMITAQLNGLNEKLLSNKQVTQKLTSDLLGVEQQKTVLEMELEKWKQITVPLQTAPSVNMECASQCTTSPAPTNPASFALEAEVKQLQTRLKTTIAEVTRQVATNKALRGQLQEKEDKLRQLQEKVSHLERDVTTKKQLGEDLKTRLKFLQEMEKSYKGQAEDLEKKVKTLSEEASNRKTFIESLKRRLSVMTTEKNQYEALCPKLKEDLEKKEQRIHALQARVGASEQALAAQAQTATEQMVGLTQQSSLALDRLQRHRRHAETQLEQLHSFIKALASEILLDVQEVKQQLMKRRRLRQANSMAAKGSLSTKSMIKVKSMAASILNMSENDLADIMEADQSAEIYSEGARDQEWLDHLNLILQQKIPSAGQLMEALRVKMKERKVLTEELAMLATPVSEKA